MDERYETLVRRLAVVDAHTVGAALRMPVGPGDGLDARTTALVRLAGLVALGSSPQTFEWAVAAALDAGCSEHDVVAVLDALAPLVGTARVSSAAENVATAIGCHTGPAGRD